MKCLGCGDDLKFYEMTEDKLCVPCVSAEQWKARALRYEVFLDEFQRHLALCERNANVSTRVFMSDESKREWATIANTFAEIRADLQRRRSEAKT